MCHATNPEVWFRPNSRLSLDRLVGLMRSGELVATPRLGIRDRHHPKGYVPGQRVTLRVFDAAGAERLTASIKVEHLCIKPLSRLTKQDLLGTMMYDDWHQIQSDLSGFEGKVLDEENMVTIVAFSYVHPLITNKEKDYGDYRIAC